MATTSPLIPETEQLVTAGFLQSTTGKVVRSVFAECNPVFASGQNKSSVIFPKGCALARDPSGTGFIKANSSGTARMYVGLAAQGVMPGFSETVQTRGVFTLNDWTAIVGQQLLLPLTFYMLGVVDGTLTTTQPTNGICHRVGIAISFNTLSLITEIPILL